MKNRLKVATALAFVFASLSLGSGRLAAQTCDYWCHALQGGTDFTCTSETGPGSKCKGMIMGICATCTDPEFVTAPGSLTLDGSMDIGLGVTVNPLEKGTILPGKEADERPGVSLLRNQCNQVITFRSYTKEALTRLRSESSKIVI